MDYKTVNDVDVKDKIVLVRVDYNVPVENGEVVDDLRIRESLPTINLLRDKEAKGIILISHLGRPKGTTNEEFSLAPVAKALSKNIKNVSCYSC